MENNSEVGSDSMLELEGVSVKEEGFEYPLPNAPRTDLSRQPLVEELSPRNTSFVVQNPSRDGLNQFYPDEIIGPIFVPIAPFFENSLAQYISQFGTTTTMNVSVMELTQNSRRPFP